MEAMLSRRPAPKHRAPRRRFQWSSRGPLLRAGYVMSATLISVGALAMVVQASLWGVDEIGGASALSLPASSGTGRRVVFDQSEQRVWLVGPSDAVERTYLVSG